MDGTSNRKLFHLSPETAREIAGKRRLKERECLQCGTAFTTKGRGLYCSVKCRRHAEYVRSKSHSDTD
jgi:hypothetical protein